MHALESLPMRFTPKGSAHGSGGSVGKPVSQKVL